MNIYRDVLRHLQIIKRKYDVEISLLIVVEAA